MSIKGSPYARFQRALDTGNLAVIRGAAAELPRVDLSDALRICLVLRDAEPESYERAVVRWLGRFCLERPAVTLSELQRAVAAFRRLPGDPNAVRRELEALCR